MNETNARIFFRIQRKQLAAAILFLTFAAVTSTAQEMALHLDPQHTNIAFTLGDVLHTVHGNFQLKRGSLGLNPSLGKVAGEVVVDAKSGASGNGMRDRKMHREVLESDRYPEIAFRPDHFAGVISLHGKSSVSVHGIFSMHGTDHEITVPAEVEMLPNRWTATLHFDVPYAKWGMKNPSTLFLRVNDSVQIDVTAAGTISGP